MPINHWPFFLMTLHPFQPLWAVLGKMRVPKMVFKGRRKKPEVKLDQVPEHGSWKHVQKERSWMNKGMSRRSAAENILKGQTVSRGNGNRLRKQMSKAGKWESKAAVISQQKSVIRYAWACAHAFPAHLVHGAITLIPPHVTSFYFPLLSLSLFLFFFFLAALCSV